MSPQNFERRSLELTPDEWGALDRLAAATSSQAPTGPNAGRPSWRTLIKRIADHELTISPPPQQ
jgi:hypothetical protein